MNHIYQEPQFGPDYFTYPKFYSDMVARFPSGSKFVEVGSFMGKSASFMAVEIINSGKAIEFHCVDLWGSVMDGHDFDGERAYQSFLSNIAPVSAPITVVRGCSWEAAANYEDGSLDFVFIDADHFYESVKKDIHAWMPKVKKGGVLSGHDYFYKDVKKAVNEILGEQDWGRNVGQACWMKEIQ